MQYLKRLGFFLFLYFLFAGIVMAKESLEMHIAGISGDALKNIQSTLAVEQTQYENKLTTDTIRTLYHNAPNHIQTALKPFGYFKATIMHSSLTHQGNHWQAYFQINPGPAVHIVGLDVQVSGPGKNNSTIQKFIRHFPVKSGDILLTSAYENAKTAFFNVVNNEGYLKATLVKKELRINLAKNTAVIILMMETGQRYYFGSLTFSDSPFAAGFLRRFAEFHPDEPFSSQKILKFQQDLTNSHYFREVIVTPEFDHIENGRVPTQVQLTALAPRKYKLGLGYGTFTGPRLLAGIDIRHIGDSGQHLTALAKLSPVFKGLAAKYFIPGSNPLTDQYTLGANIQQFRPQNGNSFSESISGAYVKMIHKWQHSFSLNLLNERYTFNNQPRRNSHEFYPAYTLSHVAMDSITDPHSGKMVSFTVQGSSEKLFSTTSFIQSEIKAKFIFSPTLASRVILRGDLGYTVVNDINQLPLTLQYLAGGPGSVRGYNYGSIGPGRYLEIVSAEYQHRLIDNLYGALFYDVGTATNKFNQGFKRGDGLGLVYLSPIGPVQIYLARAESKSWKPKSIIFSIGAEF